MRSSRLCQLSAVCAALGVLPAPAAEIEVVIEGLRSGSGQIRVALCPRSQFLSENCDFSAYGPASDGRVRIGDVPPGLYAAQAFHDENGNGQLDSGIMRRPLEGLAFSRDAPMRRGPPQFDDAAFRLQEPGGTITLQMRYF